jgi:hypothetical protein
MIDEIEAALDSWNALRPGWLAHIVRAEALVRGHIDVTIAVRGPDGDEREILPFILDPERGRPTSFEIEAIVEGVAQRMRR